MRHSARELDGREECFCCRLCSANRREGIKEGAFRKSDHVFLKNASFLSFFCWESTSTLVNCHFAHRIPTQSPRFELSTPFRPKSSHSTVWSIVFKALLCSLAALSTEKKKRRKRKEEKRKQVFSFPFLSQSLSFHHWKRVRKQVDVGSCQWSRKLTC